MNLSMSLIEEHLYLGSISAAEDVCEGRVTEPKITHIISVQNDVDLRPIDTAITIHRIVAEDDYRQDLLSYFAETNDIIEKCQKSRTNVLVHCMAGISRSATIVIAYIMYKHKKSYETAEEFVRNKRAFIYPNDGFISQLRLYEEMGFTLNANYRKLRYNLIQNYIYRKYGPIDDISGINEYFNRLSVVEKLTPNLDLGQSYSCSKCNHKLFNELHILKNKPEANYCSDQSCDTVYIEPQKWMSELFRFRHNDEYPEIKCSNCSQSVAKFHSNFDRFECNCVDHINIQCLKIQMLDNFFKPTPVDPQVVGSGSKEEQIQN